MLILYLHKDHGFILCKNLSFNKNAVWIQYIILNFYNLNLKERIIKTKSHAFLPYVKSLSKFPKAFLQDSNLPTSLTPESIIDDKKNRKSLKRSIWEN